MPLLLEFEPRATAPEVIGVDMDVRLWHPRRHYTQSLIGKKPPQFREAAPPSSSTDGKKFAGTALIISRRGAAAVSVAGSL